MTANGRESGQIWSPIVDQIRTKNVPEMQSNNKNENNDNSPCIYLANINKNPVYSTVPRRLYRMEGYTGIFTEIF